MPYRQQVIVPGEVYHVFNRSVGRIPIFETKNDFKRALEVTYFYRFDRPPIKFSKYNRLPLDQKQFFYKNLKTDKKKIVEVLAYCLMPNHFHFLIKETKEKGITDFMRNFQNSYAKYYNTKSDRAGSVFQSQFKAVRVESDEQLIHLARYIHLNPLTSYLIRSPRELDQYAWSSWVEYLGLRVGDFLNPELILGQFPSINSFKEFTFDQIDYQRTLHQIKSLALE